MFCWTKVASYNAAGGCAALRMYPDPLWEYQGGESQSDLETDPEGSCVQCKVVPDARFRIQRAVVTARICRITLGESPHPDPRVSLMPHWHGPTQGVMIRRACNSEEPKNNVVMSV